jgi:hypothetical protein
MEHVYLYVCDEESIDRPGLGTSQHLYIYTEEYFYTRINARSPFYKQCHCLKNNWRGHAGPASNQRMLATPPPTTI